jgi:hypothetical protein
VLTRTALREFAVIEALLVICFIAITGYCLVVYWPRLRWSLQTLRHPDRLRPQYRPDRPRYDLRDVRKP